MSRISPDRWYEPTLTLVVASAAAIAVRVLRGNSRVIAGGMVFIAAALILVIVALWSRAERPERKHKLVYGLLPIMLISAFLAIDLRYILEHGMVINTAGLIALIVGGFFARFRL